MHITKKLPLLATLLLLLLAASCGTAGDRTKIKGKFKNISDAEFYIYDETGTENIFDTIQIRDGNFTYECLLDEPRVLTMLFPNFLQIRFVAEPGKEIDIKGDATQLMKTDIGGTESNKALTEFRHEYGNLPVAEQQEAAAKYIRSHAATHTATALFVQYFAQAEQFDSLTTGLIRTMLDAQPDNAVLRVYERRLAAIAAVSPGTTLPSFTAVDMKGDTVRSDDYGQRPLIVLFWSSWNNKCRTYAAAVRRCKQTYGQDFDMLTLSLDYSLFTTNRRAVSDSLPGHVICDGESFDSPLAKTLGVRYVPGLLLVDKDRKIVARDLPADKLHDELGKLINP